VDCSWIVDARLAISEFGPSARSTASMACRFVRAVQPVEHHSAYLRYESRTCFSTKQTETTQHCLRWKDELQIDVGK
jgi:hypothetical protein